MRTHTLLCLLVCTQILFAQENDSLYLTRTYTPEQLREDLIFFRTNLEEGHAAPYIYTSKQQFDAAFEAVEQALNRAMTEQEFLKLLRPLIEKLHCSHSGINHSLAYRNSKNSTWGLPFLTRVIDDRLYVIESVLDSFTLAAGTEILRINGMVVDSLVRVFQDVTNTDGYSAGLKEEVVSRYFINYFSFWVGASDNYQLLYSDKDGDLKTGQFPAFEYLSTQPLLFSGKHTFGEVDTLMTYRNLNGIDNVYRSKEVSKTVILDMDYFAPRMNERYKKSLFPYLQNEGIEHLVIDLRDNTGGNMATSLHLLSYLLDEEMSFSITRNKKELAHKSELLPSISRLLSDLLLRFMPGKMRKNRKGDEVLYQMNMKPVTENRFKGKVYLLVNGLSASASAFFAANMQRFKRATILGTETGGTANAFQNGTPIYRWELPNSKLRMGIPYMRLYTGHQTDFGRGVLPDYTFRYSIEDRLSNRDLEMEKVYELIRSEKAMKPTP